MPTLHVDDYAVVAPVLAAYRDPGDDAVGVRDGRISIEILTGLGQPFRMRRKYREVSGQQLRRTQSFDEFAESIGSPMKRTQLFDEFAGKYWVSDIWWTQLFLIKVLLGQQEDVDSIDESIDEFVKKY